MPGRTQSARTAASWPWRRVAALLHTLRSPGRPSVTRSNTAHCAVMSLASSASAKCVISAISSTWGSADRRAWAARKRSGVKPRRFMPEFILRNTRCGACVLCMASQSICASQCTVCHRFRREHSSRSRGSNTPSSSRMGPRQPSAHALGLGQVEQGKAVGAAQAFIRALDAVAVGVGLDDGPQARAWGGGAQARQVVAQRAGVDGGLDGAGHGGGWTMADGRRFWHPPACVWVRIMRARARAITRHLARLRIVVVPSHFRSPTPIPMKRGFYTIMAAQFFSSLADNALFVAAVEMLRRSGATDWQRPRWCPCSRCSTCCWRPGWAPSPTRGPRAR
jgi:hypothetical protein